MAIDTFLKSDTFSGRFFNSLFKGKFNLYLTISRSFISCKEVESGKFWGLRYLIELKSRPALYRPNFRPISKRRFSALQCQYRHEIYRTPSRRGLEPLWKISRPQLFRFRNYERVNKVRHPWQSRIFWASCVAESRVLQRLLFLLFLRFWYVLFKLRGS